MCGGRLSAVFLAAIAVTLVISAGVVATIGFTVITDNTFVYESIQNAFMLSINSPNNTICNITLFMPNFTVDSVSEIINWSHQNGTNWINWNTTTNCLTSGTVNYSLFGFTANANPVDENTTDVWQVSVVNNNEIGTGTISILIINDVEPPVPIQASPENNYSSGTDNISFNCTASDNLALANITLYISGAPNGTNTSSGNYSEAAFGRTLIDGAYSWFCAACDTSGNCVNFTQNTLTVDTNLPTLVLYSPLNKTYKVAEPLELNYSAYDLNLQSCRYEVNGTSVVMPFCGNTTLSLPDGPHTLTLYANDTAGHENSTAVTFEVDKTLPFMTSFLKYEGNPGAGGKNYFSPNGDGLFDTVWANINFSEQVAYEIAAYNSTGENVAWVSGSGTGLFVASNSTLALPDGKYTANITMTDSAGNSNHSEIGEAAIDNTPPELAFINPPGNAETSAGSVVVVVNVSHSEAGSGPDTLIISLDGVALYNSTYSGAGYTAVNYTAGTGFHTYTTWANDSAGNSRTISGSFSVTPPVPPVPNVPGGFSIGGGCVWSWNCTDWSGCTTEGNQTRLCRNTGSCSDMFNPPALVRECSLIETCGDGVQNQDEKAIDCGGPNCAPCRVCAESNDCESGYTCLFMGGSGHCVPTTLPESCIDGVQNQGEEGIDCGGPCDPCGSSAGSGTHEGTMKGPAGMVVFSSSEMAMAASVVVIGALAGIYFFTRRLKSDDISVVMN